MIFTHIKGFLGENKTSNEELKLINQYTRRPLTAEEVYSFSVVLCDNEIDRDFEQFTPETLKTFETLFVGKTGIFDHSMKGSDQIARTYMCYLEETNEKNSLGEQYLRLVAKAYMPRTPKTEELISRLEAGILKEVSVSCSVAEEICSVCGVNRRESPCEHRKGKTYGSGMKRLQCHTKLQKPTDAYEWSFVAVPAQRRAGVIKSYKKEGVNGVKAEEIIKSFSGGEITLTEAEATAIKQEFENLHAACKGYLEGLRSKAMQNVAELLPNLDAQLLCSIIEGMNPTQLKGLCAALDKTKKAEPQLKATKENFGSSNNEFVI